MVGASACVGSRTQESFENEVHARGGGLSQQLVLDGIVAVAEHQHTNPVHLRSITVQPARVAFEAQVPGTTSDLDAYTFGTSGMYGGGGLSGPEPVHTNSTDPPLEGTTFTAHAAGIEHFDTTVDQALDEAKLPGGWASSASISRPVGGGDPQTTVTVTNRRRTVAVTFDADGSVLGATP